MTNEIDAVYKTGWLPIPDTRWKVETIVNGRFKTLGIITVKGSVVGAEMDAHKTIKGYEPCDIAHKIAGQKFPNANPIMISKVW
jgi:hypothetical protein